jgi:hypothetical protein
MLFSATGYVVVGIVALVFAVSSNASYDASPAKAVGSVLAMVCGGLLLGLGMVPLVAWAREGAHAAAHRARR